MLLSETVINAPRVFGKEFALRVERFMPKQVARYFDPVFYRCGLIAERPVTAPKQPVPPKGLDAMLHIWPHRIKCGIVRAAVRKDARDLA